MSEPAGVVRLVVATSNPHKVNEITSIIANPGIVVAGINGYPEVSLPPEEGETFKENARLKACSAAAQTREICLADDSGLCVDALGGAPGVHSNRFLGDDSTPQERNEAVLRLLAQAKPEERHARFVCAACICFPDGRMLENIATCEGRIARHPSGTHGFGYDPIFYVPELGKTLAEIPAADKNAISHRGKAVRAVVSLLLKTLSERA